MSNREMVIRTCTVCDRQYLGGTYTQHRQGHPRRETEQQARVNHLLGEGHTQSEVARLLGVSRQRVSALVRKGENAA